MHRLAFIVLASIACGAPSSTRTAQVAEPVQPEPMTPSGTLGRTCAEASDCDDSTRCIHFCDDQREHDETCERRSPHGFCADPPEQRRSVPLQELALVFVAEGVHIPVVGHDQEMEAARVLHVASGVAAGYRAGPADAELRGRRFDVMGERGRVCSAVVDSSWIVGLEPLETWEGGDQPGVGDTVEDLPYANQNGAVYRTLRLEPEGDCTGALWVRDASLPAIGHGAAGEREATPQDLDTYRSLPVHAMMQYVFEVYDPERDGSWMEGGEGRGFGPLAYDVVVDRDARVVISTWAGDICWGFQGTLMAVFRADGRVESIAWESRSALQPTVGLDVDGDGRLELIEHEGFAARLFSPTLNTETAFAVAQPTTGC